MLVPPKSGSTAEYIVILHGILAFEPYPLISKSLFLRAVLGETLLFLMSYKIVGSNLEHVSFDA